MNKTTITKLPKSKVEVRVEIPADEFAIFGEKALGEFVKNTEVAGFRKGAAPKDLVKNKVGQAKILDRAAGLAIEATFPEVIALNHLEPLGYPEVNILKLAEGNPLEYKAVIAVYPEASLPDYKQIAAGFKLEEVKVTDDDIKRLKMEKERHLREHLRQDVLAAVAQKAMVEIPDILIERETEKTMHHLKERTPQVLNMSFEEYLKKLGKTEGQLEEAMAKDNEAKIKNYLVLDQIAKLEKIEVSEAEILAAIKKESDAVKTGEDVTEKGDAPATEATIDEQTRGYYRETLRTEKTFEFLEGLFKK